MKQSTKLAIAAVLKALAWLLVIVGLVLVITALMENDKADGGLTPPPPVRQNQPQHTDNA